MVKCPECHADMESKGKGKINTRLSFGEYKGFYVNIHSCPKCNRVVLEDRNEDELGNPLGK
jgi:Zn-finger nucleic acid-binding protein